jgi:hypothetical protein
MRKIVQKAGTFEPIRSTKYRYPINNSSTQAAERLKSRREFFILLYH